MYAYRQSSIHAYTISATSKRHDVAYFIRHFTTSHKNIFLCSMVRQSMYLCSVVIFIKISWLSSNSVNDHDKSAVIFLKTSTIFVRATEWRLRPAYRSQLTCVFMHTIRVTTGVWDAFRTLRYMRKVTSVSTYIVKTCNILLLCKYSHWLTSKNLS